MTNQEILAKLNWRYATKKFDTTKKLSADDVAFLEEVLRLSPSSFGIQPWKFIHVTDTDLRAKLGAAAWNQPQITEASELFVLAAKTELNSEFVNELVSDMVTEKGLQPEMLQGYKDMIVGTIESHDENSMLIWNSKQVYIAAGMLLSACAMREIDACPMEGFSKDDFDKILGLEGQGLKSMVVITAGYRSANEVQHGKKFRFAKEKVIVEK